jgi:hypothetical protein
MYAAADECPSQALKEELVEINDRPTSRNSETFRKEKVAEALVIELTPLTRHRQLMT